MARTIQEIYNAIIAEKEAQTELNALTPIDDSQTLLNDLTTASRVAVWRLLLWIVAVAIWAHEKVFDAHKTEIEALSDQLISGTLGWYVAKVKAFQFGDALQWNDTTYSFEYPDGSTGANVVSQASAIEVGNQVRIKVAKSDSGLLVPLSGNEETALLAYLQRIKFAGTNISVTNINPDKLKLSVKIYYDPLTLGADGVLLSDGVTRPVDVAIESFIQNLPFDSVFNLTQFVDVIQGADGVIDPVLVSVEAQAGANPYQSTGQNYIADAGHLTIDPSFPLTSSSVIEYIAQL